MQNEEEKVEDYKVKKNVTENKYKSVIYSIMIVIWGIWMCDIIDVMHYYSHKMEYTEYEATIIDFQTTGRRHKNYYCTVEFYDEDGTYCINSDIDRQFGDAREDMITIYVTDEGRIYRKGYIKVMSSILAKIAYGIFLVVGVLNKVKAVNTK